MRIIFVILSTAALFFVGGCRSPRTIDLDAGLRGTRRGEYTLVVVTDQFVSFQNSTHKDQYYYTNPLPPEVLAPIRTAVATGSKLSPSIHFEDARTTPRPGA